MNGACAEAHHTALLIVREIPIIIYIIIQKREIHYAQFPNKVAPGGHGNNTRSEMGD